jgi:hypothetical protein
VSDHQLPSAEADVEQLNSRLSQGLEACHSVVSNYRTLLLRAEVEPQHNDNTPQPKRVDDP